MAYQPVDVVEVIMWGSRVGAVALDEHGYYSFAYTKSWRERGIEISPIHMPTSTEKQTTFYDLPEKTFYRLPPFLADVLPDDFGNALINAELAKKGVPASQITPLDRLAYMSARGMGAIEFRPPRGPRASKATAIDLSKLVEGSRRALRGQFSGDRETEAAIMNIIQVGTSAGGARAKAVIAWNEETNEIRSGQLPADPGFEHWLIKFDGVGKDDELGSGAHYGRIEYAYYLMAKDAGVAMMPCRLLEENGRAHFMTRRFDREGNRKIHTQSLCAMAHLDFRQRGTHTYSQYFLTIKELVLDGMELQEAFRRMVFNVLASNCDDHTKNFSFLLEESGKWKLAPAYDISYAYNPKGFWTNQHLMSVNDNFLDITYSDFMQVADRYEVPNAAGIIKQVYEAVENWPAYAKEAKVPKAQVEKIAKRLEEVKATSLPPSKLQSWRMRRAEKKEQECESNPKPKTPK